MCKRRARKSQNVRPPDNANAFVRAENLGDTYVEYYVGDIRIS